MDPDFVRPWNKGYLVWCVGLLGGMLALEPVVRVACEAVLDGRTPRPLALVSNCVRTRAPKRAWGPRMRRLGP